jgi:hypothetical protein
MLMEGSEAVPMRAYDPSVADYRATSPYEWGGFAYIIGLSRSASLTSG